MSEVKLTKHAKFMHFYKFICPRFHEGNPFLFFAKVAGAWNFMKDWNSIYGELLLMPSLGRPEGYSLPSAFGLPQWNCTPIWEVHFLETSVNKIVWECLLPKCLAEITPYESINQFHLHSNWFSSSNVGKKKKKKPSITRCWGDCFMFSALQRAHSSHIFQMKRLIWSHFYTKFRKLLSRNIRRMARC